MGEIENSKIAIIDAYVTTDGNRFFDFRDAEIHQKKLDFYDVFGEQQCIFKGLQDVKPEDLLNWIESNRDLILKIFGM